MLLFVEAMGVPFIEIRRHSAFRFPTFYPRPLARPHSAREKGIFVAELSVLGSLALLCSAVAVARVVSKAAIRIGVPPLLLEMAAGFTVGNAFFPFSSLSGTQGLTELGIAALFFLVGLHLDVRSLKTHAFDVFRTVAVSSLVPFLFLPLFVWAFGTFSKALFVLAVVMATGTGVTLRALEELGAARTRTASLLVSISVLDDIPAVLTLVVATHMLSATDFGDALPPWAGLLAAACLFLIAFAAVAASRQKDALSRSPPPAFFLVTILVLCAWAGEATGTTPLFGALCAGFFVRRFFPESAPVEAHLRFASEVLVPLYFVTVGMRVTSESLLSPQSWALAAMLCGVAFAVKTLCVFGIGRKARADGVDPWVVAFGLIPRGLPGLVFATSALSLGAINENEFSSLVLMVVVTTVVGLVLLGRRVRNTTPRQFLPP
jgi:Kef-type K+ transport system membrane component KefB